MYIKLGIRQGDVKGIDKDRTVGITTNVVTIPTAYHLTTINQIH